jgi:hypothetical protein
MLTYGLRSLTLRHAAATLTEVFGIKFELHDSSFYGGDYFRADVPAGTIYIQSNHDILDDEPFEASWPLDQFLISFAGLDDKEWEPYRSLLAGLEASDEVRFIKQKIG